MPNTIKKINALKKPRNALMMLRIGLMATSSLMLLPACTDDLQHTMDHTDSPNLNNLSEFAQRSTQTLSDIKDQTQHHVQNTVAHITPLTVSDTAMCFERTAPIVYTVCSVAQTDLTDKNFMLRLFWQSRTSSLSPNQTLSPHKASNQNEQTTLATEQKPLYTFDNLVADLNQQRVKPAKNASSVNATNTADAPKLTLRFAMNAGMYDRNFAPIGYTVMEGEQIMSLNLNEGGGNFHLLPNGVFWWNAAGEAYVTESHAMQKMLDAGVARPMFATQSGPMLVIDGNIHPKFNANSTSYKFRNGVGVCDDGNIKFAISDEPVNFYAFANVFKHELGCPNALFLDGGVASALYAPDIDRNDGKNMGVMIGVVETGQSVD